MKYESIFVYWITCLCSRGLTVHILRCATIQRLLYVASMEFYICYRTIWKNNCSSQINNHAGCFLFSIIFSAKFYSVVAFHTQRTYFFLSTFLRKCLLNLTFLQKGKTGVKLNCNNTFSKVEYKRTISVTGIKYHVEASVAINFLYNDSSPRALLKTSVTESIPCECSLLWALHIVSAQFIKHIFLIHQSILYHFFRITWKAMSFIMESSCIYVV